MKFISNEDTNKSPSLLCVWSLAHFLSGLGWFFFVSMFTDNALASFIFYFLLHTLYEIKDYMLYVNSDAEIKHNAPVNSLGDTLVGILGFMTGFYLLRHGVVKNKLFNKLIVLYLIFVLYILFLIHEMDTVIDALS